MKSIHLAALAMTLSLCACASTPGVRVEHASSLLAAPDTTIEVKSSDADAAWAAEQALREDAWLLSSGQWTLHAYATFNLQTRIERDPWCDRFSHGVHGWGWAPYHPFHRPCWPGDGVAKTETVRSLTWSLRDQNGVLLWHASARETRPAGPPLALSRRLAQALGKWQEEIRLGR